MDTKKPFSLALLFCCFIGYQPNTMAQHVLPIFTEQWTWAPWSCPYRDSCADYVSHCTFPVIVKTGVNLNAAASALYSQLKQDKCDCKALDFHSEEIVPMFFNSDPEEWREKMQPYPKQYPPDYRIDLAECHCSSPTHDGSFSATIYPIYKCPDGSSPGWDEDGSYGCTTTPFCMADVVARDFDAPALQSIAHVGLVTYNSEYLPYALEALNDEQVVHWDNKILNSFIKHPCTHGTSGDYCQYWGDRYNLISNLTYNQAEKILTIGMQQAEFEPIYNPTVSDGPYGHPGNIVAVLVYDQNNQHWEKQNAIDRARFRCDTFVNYMYHEATGVPLPQYGKDILPYATYLSFPSLRNGTRFDYSTRNQNHFRHITPSWLFEKDEILELLQQDNTSLVQLDQALSDYVKDQKIERKNKITFLWEQAINYSKNVDKFTYLTRWLSALQPVELIPEFISLYSQLNDIECKISLISLVYDSILLIEKPDYDDFLIKNNSNSIIMGQKFLINLLKYESSRKILRNVIFYLPSILQAEQAEKLIKTTIDQHNQNNSKDSKPLLTENEYYFQQLALAFSSEEMKQVLLPVLLQEIKQLKPSRQKMFNKYLSFFEKQYEEIKHGN